MNKQTIEKKTKLAVEDFFLKKGYIRTFINENDQPIETSEERRKRQKREAELLQLSLFR